MKLKISIFTLLTVASLILLFVNSCEKDINEIPVNIIDPEKFIFIDHTTIVNGELIEGNYSNGSTIDFPTYFYNEDSDVLTGSINFPINDSLNIIYGGGLFLAGLAGTGAASRLYGIYDLPFERGNFQLIDYESNGTIHLIYNDSLIVLPIDKTWTNTTSFIDTQYVDNEIATATISTYNQIINYGILDKETIEER